MAGRWDARTGTFTPAVTLPQEVRPVNLASMWVLPLVVTAPPLTYALPGPPDQAIPKGTLLKLGESGHTLLARRVAPSQWHALEDDLVVGRGEASRRPDGRIFVSIDAWHDAAFDRLAGDMQAALPRPMHTVVD